MFCHQTVSYIVSRIIHLVPTLNFPKNGQMLVFLNISPTRAYQGTRNVNISEYFAYILTKWMMACMEYATGILNVPLHFR